MSKNQLRKKNFIKMGNSLAAPASPAPEMEAEIVFGELYDYTAAGHESAASSPTELDSCINSWMCSRLST